MRNHIFALYFFLTIQLAATLFLVIDRFSMMSYMSDNREDIDLHKVSIRSLKEATGEIISEWKYQRQVEDIKASETP
jgi:hypothetical protein